MEEEWRMRVLVELIESHFSNRPMWREALRKKIYLDTKEKIPSGNIEYYLLQLEKDKIIKFDKSKILADVGKCKQIILVDTVKACEAARNIILRMQRTDVDNLSWCEKKKNMIERNMKAGVV